MEQRGKEKCTREEAYYKECSALKSVNVCLKKWSMSKTEGSAATRHLPITLLRQTHVRKGKWSE